ncbi:LOW QUALITY PROTEIN: hypothetical protein HID58_072174, partial [Brassica napus]
MGWAHDRNRWWSNQYAAGSMAFRYALMSMECPCRYAGDRGVGQRAAGSIYLPLVDSNHRDQPLIGLAEKKEKSLGLEDRGRSQTRGQGPGTQRQGPGPGGRDPGPRGRNPDPGGRDLEDGSWSNLFMEYFSPIAGNNMTFFIGLYNLHRIITLPCRSFSDALAVGMRRCPHSGDRPELAETRNIGIKDDDSDRTPGACMASVAILGLSSGRAIWFRKSCGGVYGSVPRNSERENLGEAKDQEDEEVEPRSRNRGSSCLILLALLVPLELVKAVMDFQEGLRAGFLFVFSILDAPLVLMFTAICPSEVRHHQCWDDLASCFHGTRSVPRHALSKSGGLEKHLSETHRFKDEPRGWMDLSPGTLRIFVWEPDGCVDLQGDLPVYLFEMKSSSSGRLSLIARLFGAVSSFTSSSYPLGSLKDGTRCVRLVNL